MWLVTTFLKPHTGEGVLKVLREERIPVNLLVPSQKKKFTLSEAIREARAIYGAEAQRLVFGTANILDFSQNTTGFSLEVAGKVMVVTLEDGNTLLELQKKQRSSGTQFSGILAVTFQTLGKRIGELLAAGLP